MAKVSVASPKVAVRKAGLRNSPRTVARLAVGRHVVAGSALGLAAHPAVERGNRQPRNRAEKERRPPAPQRAQFPARHVAQRRAHRNGHIKDRQDAVAIPLGIKVGQHRRRKDAEGGLAHAHQRMADEEGPVVVHPGRPQRSHAPQHRAGDDERFAPEVVAQPAGQRRRKHIKHKQRRGQRAHLLIGGVKLALDQRYLAGQNIAVNVVEKVQADKQQQRPHGGADAGANWRKGWRQGVGSGRSSAKYHEYHNRPWEA